MGEGQLNFVRSSELSSQYFEVSCLDLFGDGINILRCPFVPIVQAVFITRVAQDKPPYTLPSVSTNCMTLGIHLVTDALVTLQLDSQKLL